MGAIPAGHHAHVVVSVFVKPADGATTEDVVEAMKVFLMDASVKEGRVVSSDDARVVGVIDSVHVREGL